MGSLSAVHTPHQAHNTSHHIKPTAHHTTSSPQHITTQHITTQGKAKPLPSSLSSTHMISRSLQSQDAGVTWLLFSGSVLGMDAEEDSLRVRRPDKTQHNTIHITPHRITMFLQ
jgi:hypothetical protein